MTTAEDLEVTENAEAGRFEAHLDSEVVGFVDYRAEGGTVVATHTQVADEHEGKGFGSRLVAGMVERLRADGRLLRSECPYVSAWLDRHPDAADVADSTGS